MFVYNLKVNSKNIFKVLFCILCIIGIIICGIVVYRILFKNGEPKPTDRVYDIEPENYTNVLQTVHDAPDTYVGQRIRFTGYIYRVYDLQPTQFVLARDMVVTSDYQTLVVGFLCDCENAPNYTDGTWVELTGEITKGNYHGDIPIIKVTQINETKKPKDVYVYPPDDLYIPTASLLYSSPC